MKIWKNSLIYYHQQNINLQPNIPVKLTIFTIKNKFLLYFSAENEEK